MSTRTNGKPPLNLIMFVDLVWDGAWYSRHHLINGLAQENRVVVADAPVSWREVLRRPATALQGSTLTADAQNIPRYQPPRWLPEVHRGAMRQLLTHLRGQALERYVARRNAGSLIRYVWHYEFQEAAEALRAGPLVYHCYDKYDRYEGARPDVAGAQERALVSQASLCVAASSELANHLNELGSRRTLLLPHAVDTHLFRRQSVFPSELESLPRPVLGLVGSMTEVTDVATLRYIATTRPDWSIVLVGPSAFTSDAKRVRFEDLCQLPNVHYMGARPRTEIPGWLSGFDVGLICYDRTAWGAYNQPIKMYEYLACGLPIVSTAITAARELGDLVHCCETPEEWPAQIERALQERTPELLDRRVAFAASNSWDQRVAVLESALHELVD